MKTLKERTILVVDDEPPVREVLKRLLAQEGYRVLLAANGTEALDVIKADAPDLVLLDLVMPELGGMEVCRRIRQNPSTRLLPVIMITAKGEMSDEIAGLKKGADDYILKPFVMDDVKARVAGLFRRCTSQEDLPALGVAGPGTVLIIDDESVVRKLVTRVLTKICPTWQVAEAADVAEAKRKLMDLRPKFVILDIYLPNGGGLELCRLIQEHPWFSKTRVLVITGYPSTHIRERAFAQGAWEFLPKPFRMAELASSIGRLLA